MATKKEHWIKAPWSVSLGTAVFTLILTMIYDYFKSKPILTTVWTIIKSVVNFIWEVLNFDLKVWWVIVGIVLFILVIIIIDKLKNSEIEKPFYYDYNEDKFKHWKWSWDWILNDDKSYWKVSNLKAHCPLCDTPLIDYSSSFETEFSCPRCRFSANNSQCEDPVNIECIIIDNVNRKIKEKKNEEGSNNAKNNSK